MQYNAFSISGCQWESMRIFIKILCLLFISINLLGCNETNSNSPIINCSIDNDTLETPNEISIADESDSGIFFLSKDSRNILRYFDYEEKIIDRNFVRCKNEISNITTDQRSVYFLSDKDLFFYDSGSLIKINSNIIKIKKTTDGIIYKTTSSIYYKDKYNNKLKIDGYDIVDTTNLEPWIWRSYDNKLEIINLKIDKKHIFDINSPVTSVTLPSWESTQVLINNDISSLWYDFNKNVFEKSPYPINFNLNTRKLTKIGLIDPTDANVHQLGITDLKLVDQIYHNQIENINEDSIGNIYFSSNNLQFIRFVSGTIVSVNSGALFTINSTYTNHTSRLLKWPEPYTSAVSLTNDTGCIDCSREEAIRGELENLGLRLDYEIVTKVFKSSSKKHDTLVNVVSRGHGYYGHGETHNNHDSMSYEEAFNSFRNNMDFMKSLGLNPVLLAYPGGYGKKNSTQRALRDSGFFLGRSFNQASYPFEERFIYKSRSDLKNIWLLPILRFEHYEATGCGYCIDTTEELEKYLSKNREFGSWLIFVFHSIGFEHGWGYTKQDFFEHTINTLVKNNDIWVAPIQEVAKQVLQHKYTTLYKRGTAVFLDSGLPDTFDRVLEVKVLVNKLN